MAIVGSLFVFLALGGVFWGLAAMNYRGLGHKAVRLYWWTSREWQQGNWYLVAFVNAIGFATFTLIVLGVLLTGRSRP